ncbi:RNA demethylase alkbh9b [Dionaea muscipula]
MGSARRVRHRQSQGRRMEEESGLTPSSADDPFIMRYNPSELRIASEFLTTWLPFLSRGLCHHCTQILSRRIASVSPGNDDCSMQPSKIDVDFMALEMNGDDCCDVQSSGSWKCGVSDLCAADATEASTSESNGNVGPMPSESPASRMSWADMARDDELATEEETDPHKTSDNGILPSREIGVVAKRKTCLSRDQREYLRFTCVERKKDFIFLERIDSKPVNILDGLELHTGVFSAAEQKRIVDFIYDLQEMGQKGELRDRTFSAPRKWMRGKGRQTIQFGCCYNYATDKNGNPPGILKREVVDPLPPLFKVIIKRLIRWHVLPPSCVPDSCIVNIYEEGDCIPPHIDNHDFVRPFCTISFLSECVILFGTDLKALGPGDFSGAVSIPLPVGSVLVLNGNGADMAKHCVPAVPTKRISITFRRMDVSKRPFDYVEEPSLQGLQPLAYDAVDAEASKKSMPQLPVIRTLKSGMGRGEEPRSQGKVRARFQ